MLLLKALARVVEMLLMAAIALVGIGVGLYCLNGLVSLGSARPDRVVHLAQIRRHVGHFLTQVTTPGGVAVVALLLGVAAILAGLLLLVGLLGSRRQRMLVLEQDREHGDLLVAPRPLARVIRATVLQSPGITAAARPRIRLTHGGQRGTLRMLASRTADVDAAAADAAVHECVDPIIEPLHVQGNLRVRLASPRDARDARS